MANQQPQKKQYFKTERVLFDPLRYAKELEGVGFSREQAEVQAETFFSVVQEQLVSKRDLKELENTLLQNIKESENKLLQNIKESENKLLQNIKEVDSKTTIELEKVRLESELLRRDLKIWFGGMLVTLVVVSSTLMTLILRVTGH